MGFVANREEPAAVFAESENRRFTSSDRAIQNLIAIYAELVDAGDFAGVGRLLEHATFGGGGGSANGAEALQEMFEKTVVTYADGTPEDQSCDDEPAHRHR
ncbi:hypothetical protein [Williamsia soli]|uniref:hypothetical protein n=1 Tax=Williamsia soli TaxID=364929 RepID=UPI001F2A5754